MDDLIARIEYLEHQCSGVGEGVSIAGELAELEATLSAAVDRCGPVREVASAFTRRHLWHALEAGGPSGGGVNELDAAARRQIAESRLADLESAAAQLERVDQIDVRDLRVPRVDVPPLVEALRLVDEFERLSIRSGVVVRSLLGRIQQANEARGRSHDECEGPRQAAANAPPGPPL